MVERLLLTLLPLGLGSAVSPTLLAVTILILASKDQARLRTLVYLAGSAVTLAAIGAVAVTGGGAASGPTGQPSELSRTIDVGLGLLLIYLGLKNVLSAPKPRAWMHPDTKKPLARRLADSFALGIIMTVTDFSSLVFYLAAAKQVVDAGVGAADNLLAMSMMAAFVMLPIAAPLMLTIAAPKKSAVALDSVNAFVKKYNRYITAAICFIFGIYLLAK